MDIRTLVRFIYSGLFLFISSFTFSLDMKNMTLTNSIREFTLSNGLKVIIKEDHTTPLAGFAIAYKAGFRNDNISSRTGLTHLVEHLLFDGTKKFSKGDIARTFDSIGAHFNAYTTYDYTWYWEIFPSPGLEAVISLEADRMVNSLLTQSEVEREKNILKIELENDKKNPETLLDRELYRKVLGDKPYSYLYGKIEDIMGADRDYLYTEIYQKYYCPNNAYIIIIGNINTDSAIKMIRQYFNNIPSSKNLPEDKKSPFVFHKNISVDMKGISSGYYGKLLFDLPGWNISNPDFLGLYFISESGLIDSFNYNPLGDGGIGSYMTFKKSSFPNNLNFPADRFWQIKDTRINNILLGYHSIYNTMSLLVQFERWGSWRDIGTVYSYFNIVDQAELQKLIHNYLGKTNSSYGYIEPDPSAKKSLSASNTMMKDDFMILDNEVNLSNASSSEILASKKQEEEAYKTVTNLLINYYSNIKLITLSNGIRIIFKPAAFNNEISISVGFCAGSLYQVKPCQSLLTYSLIFDGGPQSSLKNKISSDGFNNKSITGFNNIEYQMTMPNKNFDSSISMLSRTLIDRHFIPLVFEDYKYNIIVHNQSLKKNPGAENEVMKMILERPSDFLDHEASASQIASLTLQDIDDYYHTFYRPENMVISVVGSLDAGTVTNAIAYYFGNWQPKDPTLTNSKSVKTITLKIHPSGQLKKISAPYPETVIMMAGETASRSDSTNFTAFRLLNNLFSQGMSARLFRKFRDSQGISYSTGSDYLFIGDHTIYRPYIQTLPNDVKKALSIYQNELKRFRDDGPYEMEMIKGKTGLYYSVIFEYEDSKAIAAALLRDVMQTGRYDSSLEFLNILNGLSSTEIKESLRRYFPEKYFTAAVGE